MMALAWRPREVRDDEVRPRTEEKAGAWSGKKREPQKGSCEENWPTPEWRKNRKEGADREIPRLNSGPAHARSHACSHLLEEEPAGFGTTKGHIYGFAGTAAVRIQMRKGQCLRGFVGTH